MTISANASANTIQFEGTSDPSATNVSGLWVALNATPSNGTTAASAATVTGVWQVNPAAYLMIRMRMSTLISGTTTVNINQSTASARAGGGSGGATSYIGLVATRGDLNQSSTGAGTTWIMDRSAHIARQTIPALGLKIVWGNYYVNGSSVEVSVGSGTYEASIEYPAGTFTRCLFAGSNTVVVAGGSDAITDFCGPAIPDGAKFWVRALYVNVTGGIIFSGSVPYSATDEGDLFGSGTPTNDVMTGTIANGAGGTASTGFHPYAIIGNTTNPTACLIGDSRTTGFGDLVNNFSGDTGELARTVGPAMAYTKLAIFGASLNTTVLNFTGRGRILQYCSHAIDQYGVNDIGGGRSAAQLSADRTTMAGLFVGKPMYGTTIPTNTTSSDSWATIANQTTTANPAVVVTFNGLARAGISGEAGIFDIANVVDPTAIGKWPVAPNVFATTGTANYATSDGIHESPAMNAYIQNSNVINTGAFTRR